MRVFLTERPRLKLSIVLSVPGYKPSIKQYTHFFRFINAALCRLNTHTPKHCNFCKRGISARVNAINCKYTLRVGAEIKTLVKCKCTWCKSIRDLPIKLSLAETELYINGRIACVAKNRVRFPLPLNIYWLGFR